MNKMSLTVGLIALAASGLFITPVQAQATRTWISGVGSDANPCSRTAPCQTWPGAITKTGAGGEIDTLDPGGFGAVTVTKAITLASEGTGEAGILVAGTNGITVSAGAGDVVIVRGLELDGGPTGSNSLTGIKFNTGKALEVQNCTIRNFSGGSPNGYGISFTPSAPAELDVSDATLTTNGQVGGSAGIGGGIFIQPQAGGSVKAQLTHLRILNNTNGLRVDGTLATGASSVTVVVSDSVIAASGNHGVAVITPVSGGVKTTVVLDHVSSINNTADGIVANGGTSIVYVRNSIIMGNNHGYNVANGGVINTFKDNIVAGNANDNTVVGTMATGF